MTLAGEIVWEFWSPEVVEGQRKRIYRLLRMPEKQVEERLGKR